MSFLIAVAATALSISTTNEYYFTSPGTTNLQGVTYLLTGGKIPRYEDIAFLREAYTERLSAITSGTNLISVASVPGSQAFGSGNLGGPLMPRTFFSPSFGYWGGYLVYQSGFFLNPGVSVSTDFEETGSDFLWRNGKDTSMTNTIAAFVNEQTACVPTNRIKGATLSGALSLQRMIDAYSPMTNRFYTLTRGSVYSHVRSRVRKSDRFDRVPMNDRYEEYQYPDWKGRMHTSTYLASFDLPDWQDDGSYVVTNQAPIITTYVIQSIRQMARRFGRRITYQPESGPFEYDYFQVGNDWQSWKVDTDEMLGDGNLLATDDMLERPLTNTIEDVKCIVVARISMSRIDRYTNGGGATNVPAQVTLKNYFVVSSQGNAQRTQIMSGTKHVWDTGVNLRTLVRDVIIGMDYETWVRSCSWPTLDMAPNGRDTVTVRHDRILTVSIEALPYFYYRRKWNARIPSFDN